MAKKDHKTHTPAEAKSEDQEHTAMGLERLVFFSDAVFAIAITLLALEIRLPVVEGEVTNAQLRTMLLDLWPDYLAYLISFLVIGIFWMVHHRKFNEIQRYDRNLVFINLLLLMAVGFLPFPTSVLSEYGNQTATIFYALSVMVLGLLSLLQWWYAVYKKFTPEASPEQQRRTLLRTIAIPGVFLLSIIIALFDDTWAKLTWILIVPVQIWL